MHIDLDFTHNRLHVTRELNDCTFYTESRLLHHIKLALIKAGYDVIKKRMYKDGHLYGSDDTQYIRSRHTHKPGAFMAYDGNYAIECLYEKWNRDGEVILLVTLCEED